LLGELHILSNVVRVRDVYKRPLEKFRFGVPYHLTKRVVDLLEVIVLSHEREAERPFFEHSAETFFARKARTAASANTLAWTVLEQ